MKIEQLYKQLFDPLVLFAEKLVHDFHTAEDIVQEVFVKFHRLPNKPGTEAWITNYLFKMTKNACFTRLQASNPRTTNVEKIIDTTPQPGGHPALAFENRLIKLGFYAQALKEIEKLPEQCRQVMHLYYMEEKSYAEIAAQLSISEETVRQQKHIGTKKLKNTFKKYEVTYKASKTMIFILLCWLLLAGINMVAHFF